MSENVNMLIRQNSGNVAFGPHIQRMAIRLGDGATELVAAVAGEQIQIMSMSISVQRPVTMTLQTGSDEIISLHAGGMGGVNYAPSNEPWFVGKLGQNINIDCGTDPGSTAGAVVVYRIARVA